MPPTSPAAGDVTPSRSASAIVADAVSGYHELKIFGYSRTKGVVPTGKCIKSCPFRVGGHNWAAEYYPNGNEPEKSNFISMFLALADEETEAVKAHVKIKLLDQFGSPVPAYGGTTEFVNFSEKGDWGYPKFIEREVLEKSEYLKNDSFTVRFDVTVMEDVHIKEIPFVVVPPSSMHQHFGRLLSSKEGADVNFHVGSRTISAHRLVLAARSPVFKAQLNGSMKEGTTTMAIPIDDMEPEVFEALLSFIYTDSLPDMEGQEESVIAQHLLVAADRYDLERLKLICEDKLCKHIDAGSVATILSLAEQHNFQGLKEACFDFLRSSRTLDDFIESDGFEYLTSSCPSILKEFVSNVVRR